MGGGWWKEVGGRKLVEEIGREKGPLYDICRGPVEEISGRCRGREVSSIGNVQGVGGRGL